MPIRAEASAVAAAPSIQVALPAAKPPASTPFSETLSNLGKRVDAGEGWMRRALSPGVGTLDAAQLIALQAGIYRYTEAVELVGKLIDRATSGVKSVLQPH
ncbi:MAG: hypothetical protein QM756_29480 [Polyangiaceae bacterium]